MQKYIQCTFLENESNMLELCIYLALDLQTYARVIGIHAAGSLQTCVAKSKGSTGKSCCVIPDTHDWDISKHMTVFLTLSVDG